MMPDPYPETSCLHTISGRPAGALEEAIRILHPAYQPRCPLPEHAALKAALDKEKVHSAELQKSLLQMQARIKELEAQVAEKDGQLQQQSAAALSAMQLLGRAGGIEHHQVSRGYYQYKLACLQVRFCSKHLHARIPSIKFR
jgi:hypothetical protein